MSRPAGEPAALAACSRSMGGAAAALREVRARLGRTTSSEVVAGAWRGPASEAFLVDGAGLQVGVGRAADVLPQAAGALSELAGQLATPRADDEMLSLLEAEMQNMLTSARELDQHGLLVHDARFHEIIVEAAGNTVLLESWSGLRIEAYTLVSVIKSKLDLVAIANAHLPILDSFRQRDADLTGKVMREHIEHFGNTLFGGNPDA